MYLPNTYHNNHKFMKLSVKKMENQYDSIKSLIMKFKDIKANNPMVKKKNMSEFDTFKRFTTSKKDHGPQQRIVYNIRRAWPIIVKKTNTIPQKFLGRQMYKPFLDLGESSMVLSSIYLPDYLSKYGETQEWEITKSLMVFELEKVERFFQNNYEDIRYGRFFPYRTEVQIYPTIGNTVRSAVSSTIMDCLLNKYCTPDIIQRSNKDSVRELKMKIMPILGKKTTVSIIHTARKLITPEKRWLPTTTEMTPELAEICHLTNGPFHLINLVSPREGQTRSIDLLCYKILTHSKSPSVHLDERKGKVVSLLNKIKIYGVELSKHLESIESSRPGIVICKRLLNLDVKYHTYIRNTKFVNIKDDLKYSKIVKTSGVLNYGYNYEFFLPDNEVETFFMNDNIRGYFIWNKLGILNLYITPIMGVNIMEVLIDVGYYTKLLEPGFNVDFDEYVKKNDRLSKFNKVHKTDMSGLVKLFGISKNGLVDLNCIIGNRSKWFFSKIKELKESIQPYDNNSTDITIDDELNAYRKDGDKLSLLINLDQLVYKDVLLPNGLDLSKSDLYFINQSPLNTVSMLVNKLLTDEERLKKLVNCTLYGYVDDMSEVIQSTIVHDGNPQACKRRLEELNLEESAMTPTKKRKLMYLALAANSSLGKRKSRFSTSIPEKLQIKATREVISRKADRGIVVDSGTSIRVSGRIIPETKTSNIHGYVYVGYYVNKPIEMEVESIEEARAKNLKRFCIKGPVWWYVLEKAESYINQEENVRRSVVQWESIRNVTIDYNLPGTSKQKF